MAIEMLARIDEVTGGTYFAVNINGQDYRVSASDVLEYVQSGMADEPVESSYSQVVTEATGARITAASDAGSYVRFTFTGAKTYTIAPQATIVWGDNVEIHGRNAAATDLVLMPGSGVTLNVPFSGTLSIPNGGTFTLKRVALNEWDVIGQTVEA